MSSNKGRKEKRRKDDAAILPAKVTWSPAHIQDVHSTAAETVFLSNVQGDDFKSSSEIDGHVLGEARDSMVDILTGRVKTYPSLIRSISYLGNFIKGLALAIAQWCTCAATKLLRWGVEPERLANHHLSATVRHGGVNRKCLEACETSSFFYADVRTSSDP